MANLQHEIEAALEVFVYGFCVGKSATHPYECRKIENLWVMRDAPRRNPRNYRKEEWVAFGVEPAKVDSIARRQTRGRFAISAIRGVDETDEPLRSEYKRLGYRLLTTEPLFVHDLKRIPRCTAPVKIVQVKTQELAKRLGNATRSRPIPPQHLGRDAPFRQYVAMDGNSIVGWVRSVSAVGSTWCSNMYVLEEYRRRGIGSAMLATMLREDRKDQSTRSVLLSSHSGALLYPKVGYRQIGTLLLFAPKKR
jgi:GNAT superfamily N-acetyltransferase